MSRNISQLKIINIKIYLIKKYFLFPFVYPDCFTKWPCIITFRALFFRKKEDFQINLVHFLENKYSWLFPKNELKICKCNILGQQFCRLAFCGILELSKQYRMFSKAVEILGCKHTDSILFGLLPSLWEHFYTNCVGHVGSGSLECQNSTWKLHLKSVSSYVLSSYSYHPFVFMSPAHSNSSPNSVCPLPFKISTTCLI